MDNKMAEICWKCRTASVEIGWKECADCRQNRKAKTKELKRRAKMNGMCSTCYRKPPMQSGKQCEKCKNIRMNYSVVDRLFWGAQKRARDNNLDFNITKSDIIIPEYCPIFTNIKLEKNHRFARDSSHSLDRIDNSKGYVKGNIQVISNKANSMKNNATIGELELLLSYLKSLPAA